MRTYLRILEELGWPKVYLVSPKQFEAIDGDNLYKRDPDGSEYVGDSNFRERILTLHHGLRGKVLYSTIYHEVIHILQPWRRHWWVECAAESLARGGGRGYYSKRYNHTPSDLPPREKVLDLMQKASRRLNQRSM